jgi:cytochrome oxidase Cu insertion factor (SCO1/SenC/PrrC family)
VNDTPGGAESPSALGPESGEGQAAAPLDRAAALAEGTPGIPAKFGFWVLAAVLVLSLGGLLGEHVFSSAGLNPVPTTTPKAPVHVDPALIPQAPAPVRSLGAPLSSFMGLRVLRGHVAPAFTLTDQHGSATSVPAPSPRVVVLTFFDATCNDICPVLADEIEQADHDLGSSAGEVEFVTVNTDPSALAQADETPALNATGLGALPNWHMVTGPLASLDPVWRSYGVSITVAEKTGLEAHTNVMDFIDAQGDLAYEAAPFADESGTGSFSLPPTSIERWGQGIATYAGRSLLEP